MEYFVYNIDEYQPLEKGNKFSPQSPFRMIVAGSSDSGKTTMIMNLLIGTKKADKKNGSRYILCNDVVLFAKFPDEPKWKIVRDFYNELANPPEDADPGFYEDVSFKILPYDDIPDPKTFDPSRFTIAIFEDLMHESKKIQDKIAQYFTHGRHRNISPIYVSQRFFGIVKTIRDNANYISLHRGGGNLSDIKNIICRYTEHSDNLAPKIDELTLKREFIVFDLRRPKNDPLSIRIRWDRPLDIFPEIHKDSINIVDAGTSKELQPLNKFSIAGQDAIAQAKENGRLVEFAGKLPLPSERKKLLANGVTAKNSDIWARFVYREAFGINGKDLGTGWREFTQKIKENIDMRSIESSTHINNANQNESLNHKKDYMLRYKDLLDSRPLSGKKYIEGCEILLWFLSNGHIDQKTYRVGIRELENSPQ